MNEENWVVQSWKLTSKKGRIVILIGLLSLLLIAFGAFLILMGVVGLLVIGGGPNKDLSGIFEIFFTGFGVVIVGAVLLVIYMIGMRFVSSPRKTEDLNKNNR